MPGPTRTPSRRREHGSLNEREADQLRVATQRLHERLSVCELQPIDPNELAPALIRARDCQFAAVLLALQHPLRIGSLCPINPGRKPPITPQEVTKTRKQAKKWMVDRYFDLHKNSGSVGSWFTHYDINESDCLSKQGWRERASQYAPADNWEDRCLGDRMSQFALAHIYKVWWLFIASKRNENIHGDVRVNGRAKRPTPREAAVYAPGDTTKH